jgi:GT2 family glycosyltransferase
MILKKRNAIGTIAYVATAPFTMERFCYSYGKMIGYNTSHLETEDKFIYYDRQQVSWIPRGRNDIVKSMRGDWLFMLDADLEFEPDSFARLLEVAEKYQAPVLTGLYVMKKKPHYPIIYSHNAKRKVYELIAKWSPTDIFQVDAAPGGFLFIRKFVFNMIWDKLNEDPFTPIKVLGEDFSFFDRLRRIGVGVYCAPNIQISHLNVVNEDYDEENISKKLLTKPYKR